MEIMFSLESTIDTDECFKQVTIMPNLGLYVKLYMLAYVYVLSLETLERNKPNGAKSKFFN